MALPLIQTKLFIPASQQQLVARPRLSHRLEEGLVSGCRLSLVAAPAGFGKTTVVSSWVKERGQKCAWLSLDEQDNENGLFWVYVLTALQNALPGFGNDLLARLQGPSPPPPAAFLTEMVNEFSFLKDKVILVLDDFHLISSEDIHKDLTFLLKHAPPQLHLVIATRADPPLPLSSLRAQRLLTELRSEDLRFTPEESRVFLNEVMGLDLGEEELRLLEKRTEGWGVGLLLAAQSMQGRGDKHEFIQSFSGSHHYILEYLIEEVLLRQPEDRRLFLLQTSILETFCASLCRQLSGKTNSREILEEMNRQNLFLLSLDSHNTWFRYHHLFADLLRSHLQRDFSPAEVRALYQKAAGWYEENGDNPSAIRYYLNAEEFTKAADLIEQVMENLLARGQVKVLLGWFNALPEEVISTRPQILLHKGWVAFLSGRITYCGELLQQAAKALENIGNESERRQTYGRLSALQSTITSLTGNFEQAAIEAEEALRSLREDDYIFKARAARVLGVCRIFNQELERAVITLEEALQLALKAGSYFLSAEILFQTATARKNQGKYSLAHQAFKRVLKLFEKPEDTFISSLGFAGLGEMCFELNELEEADDLISTAIRLGLQGNIGYVLYPAYLYQGLIKNALGQTEESRKAISNAEKMSQLEGGSLERVLELTWAQVRINLFNGNLEEAEGWARGKLIPAGWSFEDLPPLLFEFQQNLLARVLLKKGDYESALQIVKNMLNNPAVERPPIRRTELLFLQATALQALGEDKSGLVSMENCLQDLEAEYYVRRFLEAGPAAARLLQEIRKQKSKNGEKAAWLLQALEGEEKQTGQDVRSQYLVEALTSREMEILVFLCQGLTNQEIAEKLIVSVNTVKKHTNNIYGKLGVSSRSQAILAAQEKGLVK